jgi:hypothetical protein
MFFRIGRFVVVATLAMVGASAVAASAWASDCADLPPSILRIFDIRVSMPEVISVPAATLDRIPQEDQLGSHHTFMLTGADVVTLFEIRHRIVSQADGSVCDAPSLVRIGFGAGRRVAYLARKAAADECVRQAMLAHEEAHNRSFNDTVDRFIEQEKAEFQRGMLALKRTPAPSAEMAKARWQAGLVTIIAGAKRQLLSEIRAAKAQIDGGPTLTALAEACGGKIRHLQEASGL